jgi:hypothetical protein
MTHTTTELAQALVDACKAGREATHAMQTAIYSPDAVSVEPQAMGPEGAEAVGLAAIQGKGDWWYDNHTVHSLETEGPFVHGDQFTVIFTMDVTGSVGPMAGQRFQGREVGLYTTSNGQITREQFFGPPMPAA